MMRWLAKATVVVALMTGCGSDDAAIDLANQDLTRDGLRGVDLGGLTLTDTSWDNVDWRTVDIESLVQALGLTFGDHSEGRSLDEMIDSYSEYLGTDPDIGSAEEDIVFWMMSVQLDRLARDLDIEGFDAFRAEATSWPDLLPDGSAQFRERMEGLVSKSFHLRQALSIETGR